MTQESPHILLIESATTNCSVGVAKGNQLVALKEQNAPDFRHSDHLHVFIETCMEEAAIGFEQLAAVAVSKGPGSYTGLRIGVASAKGICYAHDLPLLAINTLEILAQQCVVSRPATLYPMIDARRMEVFTLGLDQHHNTVLPCTASIVDQEAFKNQLIPGEKHFFGSGAAKCKSLFRGKDFVYHDDIRVPSAKDMVSLAVQKYDNQQFEDVAYFEPFYLKDFYTNAPKTSSPKTP